MQLIFNTHDPKQILDPPEMLPQVLERATRFDADQMICTPFQREKNGFMEWQFGLFKDGRRLIYIGAIQREPGAPIEFHS